MISANTDYNGQVHGRVLDLFTRFTPETATDLALYKIMGRDAAGEVELRKFTDPAQFSRALEDLRAGLDVYAMVGKEY